jgi:CHAD domain-containing protein
MCAFEFAPRIGVKENFLNIAHEQLQIAHDSLTQEDDFEKAIYGARKCTKRLRALLRLVRTGLLPTDFNRENAALRSVAEALGGPREIQVALKFLNKLPETLHELEAFKAARDLLEKDYAGKKVALSDGSLVKGVLVDLANIKARLEHLEVWGDGFLILRPNLLFTMKAGRRKFEKCLEAQNEYNMHEWRKGVKRLWYHTTLLRGIDPTTLEPLIEQLDEMGETLGTAHDWAVLHLLIDPAIKTVADAPLLLEGIHAAQKVEEEAAIASGHLLYKDLRPNKFVKALGEKWHDFMTKETDDPA